VLWIVLLLLAMVFAGLRAWAYAAPPRERRLLVGDAGKQPSRLQLLLGVVPFLGIAVFFVGYGVVAERYWLSAYGVLSVAYFGYVLWRVRRRSG
jgi:hypothetical protein